MKFTDRLWLKVEGLWDSYLEHPFVKGIGEGTLEVDKFQHWLKQDYVYLVEYSRLMAIGAEKSPDLHAMNMFAELLHGTLFVEMDLHREFSATFDIPAETLENTEASATNTAYTSYMLSHAQRGDAAVTTACLLCCAWSYNHIGKGLAANEGYNDNNPYKAWIDMYSGEEFTELTNTAMALMDRLAENKPEKELEYLEEIVLKTGLYEYMFWDMCENKEEWPITVQ